MSRFIDRVELFNRLAVINAPPEANEYKAEVFGVINSLPSAPVEADGYTEWLEKLIVDLESFEWICEDTPCPEWCSENCSYASIQAECLRHLFKASKGGDDE